MSLDHLWAGWRASYVSSVTGQESAPVADDGSGPVNGESCVFCQIIASTESDETRRVVHTTERSIAILNAYPYAPGHLLLMPLRHVSDLAELDGEESSDLWNLARDGARAITSAYEPDGMNLGANLGRAAGAGIPQHLHLHVVPRWIGDTNFMTSVASVRVLPEALDLSWSKLSRNWPR